MALPVYTVDILWDSEAAVWTAESESIPGLVLGSGSLDALIERVRHAAPELLELNGIDVTSFTIDFKAQRQEMIRIYMAEQKNY